MKMSDHRHRNNCPLLLIISINKINTTVVVNKIVTKKVKHFYNKKSFFFLHFVNYVKTQLPKSQLYYACLYFSNNQQGLSSAKSFLDEYLFYPIAYKTRLIDI